MDCYATNRSVSWSVRDGVYAFRFAKDGHTYIWRCVADARKDCLLNVVGAAHSDDLNLSLVDAAFITERIREVVPVLPEWIEVEADPIVLDDNLADVRWLGWVITWALVFWAWVAYFAARLLYARVF